MTKFTKFIAIALFAVSSSIYAHGYLSLGGGSSIIGPSDSSDSYKVALGFAVDDNIVLEMHYADLGTTNNNATYKYTGLGANYYFDNGDSQFTPFIGGGVAKFTTSGPTNKEIQAYGTGGMKFALEAETGMHGQISYTRYADDGTAVFIDLIQDF